MKNRLALLTGIASALVMLAIIIAAYMMLHHPDKMAALNKLMAQALPQHHLIVIDFDDNGLQDKAELMQGLDGVITVNDPNLGVNEAFNSESALQKLDSNKDGRIDRHDARFAYLQLTFFTDQGKQRRYLSFRQAGIDAIKINPQRLYIPLSLPLTVKNNKIGKAFFTNGTQHDVRLIAVSVAVNNS